MREFFSLDIFRDLEDNVSDRLAATVLERLMKS